MAIDKFVSRHIGPRENDIQEMLEVIGVKSLDELIDQTIPANIRLEKPLNLSNGLTEREYYRKNSKPCQEKQGFQYLYWYGVVRYNYPGCYSS